jgi:hypothetical protein
MAESLFKEDSAELAESPAPSAPKGEGSDSSVSSGHPGLRNSFINVPVTTHLLAPPDCSSRPISHFQHDVSELGDGMAQSPTEAASGAKSNRDILRRMSLTGSRQRSDSLVEIDPRASNPTLALSGGIISAALCIPHSLKYRKGKDWVSKPTYSRLACS